MRSHAAAEIDSAPPPPIKTLAALHRAEAACTRCPLYAFATQVVAGEGPVGARLMLIGEQPGDKEDLAGKPFVGPAGKILDRALAQAAIPRHEVFVTNAGGGSVPVQVICLILSAAVRPLPLPQSCQYGRHCGTRWLHAAPRGYAQCAYSHR